MKRLLLQTALALTLMFFFLHLAFAQKLTVSWEACRLSERSLIFGLENTSPLPLSSYHLQVTVFQDGQRLVEKRLDARKALLPGNVATFRVDAGRTLRRGRSYRVEATLEPRGGRPLSYVWPDCRVARTDARAPTLDRSQLFPEVDALRFPIAGIDPKAALGLTP